MAIGERGGGGLGERERERDRECVCVCGEREKSEMGEEVCGDRERLRETFDFLHLGASSSLSTEMARNEPSLPV